MELLKAIGLLPNDDDKKEAQPTPSPPPQQQQQTSTAEEASSPSSSPSHDEPTSAPSSPPPTSSSGAVGSSRSSAGLGSATSRTLSGEWWVSLLIPKEKAPHGDSPHPPPKKHHTFPQHQHQQQADQPASPTGSLPSSPLSTSSPTLPPYDGETTTSPGTASPPTSPTSSSHSLPTHRHRSSSASASTADLVLHKLEEVVFFWNANKNKDDSNDPYANVSADSFESPSFSGWLTKQGAIHKTWRKRYFVLNQHLLYYYDGVTAPRPKGVIDLTGCEVMRDMTRGKKHCFQVSHKKNMQQRIFLLHAKDNEEMKQWMQCINDAIERTRPNGEQQQQTAPSSPLSSTASSVPPASPSLMD